MNETGIPKEEKTWAMFSHLSSLLGYTVVPLGNIIAPLVIYLIKKDTMPFASGEAKECLNFQISMMIYLAVGVLLLFVFIGFLVLPALYVLNIVFTIIAAIKANEGVPYRYPLTIRFVQ